MDRKITFDDNKYVLKEGINKLVNIFANLSLSESFIGGSGSVVGTITVVLGVGTALTAGLSGILVAVHLLILE
ncbi:hypothetical protein GIX45_26630 [Erwinia sp. CPCC 100877]|nr:hypothetical protein [Erwinia sp. CPCC 100877]